MTGWQGDEGGWNPQQDPHDQQPFGGDPFSSDPYPGQYAPDPYAPTYGSYQTDWGPPPPPEPPKRSKVPIVLSAVAILAVVGTVVTVVLLNRDGNSAPAAGADTPAATTTTRLPSSRPPSGSQPPSTSQVPGKAGWTTIPMPGGTYQVPADWQPSPVKRETGLGDSFDGGTEVGDYSCNEMSYFRGFTATGDVPSPNGAPLDLNQTIATYAKAFAGKYYQNATMNVDVPTPAPATVSGKKVATVTGKIRMTPASRCEASTGEVAILGVPLDNGGVRLLVVVNDLSGGPATPPALPDPLAEDILSTVTLS